jgi:hypothetical protein
MKLEEALELLEVRVTGTDSSNRAAVTASQAQAAARKSIGGHILDIGGDLERLGLQAFDDELALASAFRIKNLIKTLKRDLLSFERDVGKAFRKAQ